MSGRLVSVINDHLQTLVRINVANMTGCNNFDRGQSVVLILTIDYI